MAANNIKVILRVRPLNERELERNSRTVIQVIDENHIVFDPKEDLPRCDDQGLKQSSTNHLKRAYKDLKYAFDYVCGPRDTNKDVFEKATKDMLGCLMEGYNCSVFVYGATGAGKTFTMIGNKEYPGITHLIMDHLFTTMEELKINREFDIGVSYIEVYNENIYDLLRNSLHLHNRGAPLQQCGVSVVGANVKKIKTAQQLLELLRSGDKLRTQHPTDANAESSRSHGVIQVYVKMRCRSSGQCSKVKLSLIDLAGSERAAATGCVGERFKEGATINRSLLALGNCINKLAGGSSFVPYRDSKLTRLLKDSLDGNCKTVMIANVSPSSLSYEDTYNTLKYAARAKKIKIRVKKTANVENCVMDTTTAPASTINYTEELHKTQIALEEAMKNAAMWELRVAELKAKLTVCMTVEAISRSEHAWKKYLNAANISESDLENNNKENIPPIDRKDLNSTFALAGQADSKKCPRNKGPQLQGPAPGPSAPRYGANNLPRSQLKGPAPGPSVYPLRPQLQEPAPGPSAPRYGANNLPRPQLQGPAPGPSAPRYGANNLPRPQLKGPAPGPSVYPLRPQLQEPAPGPSAPRYGANNLPTNRGAESANDYDNDEYVFLTQSGPCITFAIDEEPSKSEN